MNRKLLFVPVCTAALVAAIVGSIATAQPAKDSKPAQPSKDVIKAPAGQPEMKLPPGWTPEDMQACMAAGTPGKMHEWLAKSAGTWNGKVTMWMAPGTDAIKSDCTTIIKPVMDGRYMHLETSGEMMGQPFKGAGLYGFDNVSQKFVSTWIDNMGTGILYSTGDLSADGKTLTLSGSMNCPIQKKAVTMREVEKHSSDNAMTLEMYGPDPKTGKEFKTMVIEYTKKP